jgi:DNA modification methylase
MIIQGDCLEVMKDIEDKSVDLIITDIPYGVINRNSNGLRSLNKGVADIVEFSLNSLINEFVRLTTGSIYIFCSTEQVSDLRGLMISKGLSTRLMIWNKTNPSPMNGQYIWLSSVECCVYGKFKNATFNQHCKGSVLNFPCGRNKLHPTEKPLKLFEYLIESSSNKGDVVLDPFLGSGTTAVACKKLKRQCIGIEKEEKYIEISKRRLQNEL